MVDTSHYAVLCIAPTASPDDIKKAHRRLALKWHPDKVADPTDEVAVKVATQQFQLVQAAYEVLSDAAQRQRYDAGHAGVRPRPGAPAAAKRPRGEAEGASWDGWKPAEKATLRVPQDAPDISAAVDRLPVSGGTVWVNPGTYVGLVVIAKPFVTVAAAGGGPVLVQGQVVFRECAAGAVLRGLTVRTACAQGAVDLKGVMGNVLIEGCDISNESSAGVIFEGCSGETTLKSCVVHDCKYDGLGMHVAKGRSAHRGSLVVADSAFEGNGYDGIYLGDARFTVRLERCRVTRNKRHGVFVRGATFEIAESVVEANAAEAIHREDAGAPAASTRRETAAAAEAKARVAAALAGIGAAAKRAAPGFRETHAALIAGEQATSGADGEACGWQRFFTEGGHAYYHHAATGVTQWTRPPELEEGEG